MSDTLFHIKDNLLKHPLWYTQYITCTNLIQEYFLKFLILY